MIKVINPTKTMVTLNGLNIMPSAVIAIPQSKLRKAKTLGLVEFTEATAIQLPEAPVPAAPVPAEVVTKPLKEEPVGEPAQAEPTAVAAPSDSELPADENSSGKRSGKKKKS